MKYLLRFFQPRYKYSFLAIFVLLLVYLVYRLMQVSIYQDNQVISLSESGGRTVSSCPEWSRWHQDNSAFGQALPAHFTMLVWNVFKYQEIDWKKSISKLSAQADLLLLQESTAAAEINQYWHSNGWDGLLANAFEMEGRAYGVQTLFKTQPMQACVSLATEPLIQFPKSALALLFQWQGSKEPLLVINLHGINFAIATQDLELQLLPLLVMIRQHQGPVIIAGDMNTWSDERRAMLDASLQVHGLTAVNFKPDHRLQVFGQTLDHIFVRGVRVESAVSSADSGSDHQPMIVSFSAEVITEH